MSKISGAIIAYKCSNDCQQAGCPGHTMRAYLNCSTDQYNFVIDEGTPNEWTDVIDENRYAAMIESQQTIRESVDGK